MKPRMTELYRHFDDGGQLLYVGIAIHTIERLIGHKCGSHWYDQVVSVKIERFPSRRAALDAERAAIEAENPKYNLSASQGHFAKLRREEIAAEKLKWVQRGTALGIKMRPNAALNALEATVKRASRGDWEGAKLSTAWLGLTQR